MKYEQHRKIFNIIGTINLTTIDKNFVKTMVKKGVTMLRLNGAFLKQETLKEEIQKIREWVGDDVSFLLDLPGYKLRLTHLKDELQVKAHVPFDLVPDYFNYPEFMNIVNEGVGIRVNDGLDKFVIVKKSTGKLSCLSEKDMKLKKGKGVHLDGISFRPEMHSLSRQDHDLIEIAKTGGVDFLGLSFVYHVQDIKYVEGLIGNSTMRCLPKIEAKESLASLHEIMSYCKLVLVDRGDLSAEIGIENIWEVSRMIISCSRLLGTHTIFATQFLAHMVDKPIPSISEIDSMYDLMRAGIGGIQLSEETGIGLFPFEAIDYITRIAQKASSYKTNI